MEQFLKSTDFPKYLFQSLKSLHRHSMVNVILTASTVISGAYVAGNDAGRAYGTFPLMVSVYELRVIKRCLIYAYSFWHFLCHLL